MALTDIEIRKAKPRDKAYKLSDAGGLYLYVSPAGSRLWRLKYRMRGVEKSITFGAYPDINLASARLSRDEAKEALKAGKDPVLERQRKAERAANNTFEKIAREWHEIQRPSWAPKHAHDVLHSLERDVFDHIGRLAVDDIGPREVLAVLRDIERRPAVETAHRVRQRIAAVFSFAIGMGLCETNPGAVVADALAPVISGRQPAVTSLEEAREVLRRAEATPAHPITKLALRMLALTVVRPGTLAGTPWDELAQIDRKEPIWRVPSQRLKLKQQHKHNAERDHLVPLPRQALDVIDAVKTLSARSPFVFPSTRLHHRPMCENSMGYLLNRAGYHHRHVPHGWRATFSTIMNERYRADRQVIDLMLAHTPKDEVERAYNRSLHLGRRRELAQEWADALLEGQAPLAEVMKMPRR